MTGLTARETTLQSQFSRGDQPPPNINIIDCLDSNVLQLMQFTLRRIETKRFRQRRRQLIIFFMGPY